jgi:DNA-binding MarR family transcriptional regulator
LLATGQLNNLAALSRAIRHCRPRFQLQIVDMPKTRPRRKTREVRGIRLDQQQWVAYRLSILSGYNQRGLSAMYTKRYRISVAQWRVLIVISRHEPASATTVAKNTSLEPDKVTRAVDSLVRLGLVNRRSDSRDLRFVVLTLSAKGRRVARETEMVRNALELEFVGALTVAEARKLYHLLDKLQVRAAQMFKKPEAWREILAKHRHDVSAR